MAEFSEFMGDKVVRFVTADEDPYEFDYLDTTVKCPSCGHQFDPELPND